jgi:hypothetical protein
VTVKSYRKWMLLAMVGTLACDASQTRKESASATSSTLQGVAALNAWPAESVSVSLVDTTETEQYSALKVEVTSPGRIDTIPDVLTFDRPVITPDGLLHGPTYTMDGDYRSIYTYNSRSRQVSHAPLPNDAMRWDSEVKLSPDGTHIAYVGSDSVGSRGIVRTWPTTTIVLTTESAPQPAGDYSFNGVWWENPDSVEFSWRIDLHKTINEGRDEATAFVLTGGSLSKGSSALDTLAQQPRLAH